MRATKDQLQRLAAALREHVCERMASDDPEDKTAALVNVYRRILADAKITAMAGRSTPLDLDRYGHGTEEFGFPFKPRPDDEIPH